MGIFISVTMILVNFSPTAKGAADEANWWNSFLAGSDSVSFDWNNVFNPLTTIYRGKDLYNLVYRKQTRDGEKRAINEIAKSYGLTTNEAKAVLEGSLTPIFNNPRKSLKLEAAEKVASSMQEDFKMLKEIYQIEEEVNLSVKPSEMFANGDLSDSGFDLVHDLAVMEKVLFVEQKPNSVGGLFDEALPSPYSPVKLSNEYQDYVAEDFAVATLGLGVDEDGNEEATFALDDEAAEEAAENGEEIEEVKAEVLANDVCAPEDSLADAIGDLGSGDAAGEDGDGAGEGENGGEGDDGDAGDDDDGAGGDANNKPPGLDEDGKVKPAPVDKWGSEWCPGQGNGTFAGAQAKFPPTKFKGASGKSTKSFLSGAAGANFESAGFSANVGICFETKFVMETVSSFQPGDSCIACEVEQINKFMEQTLDHSLIPNKTTGNMMESGKCKKTGSLISMQFTTIFNPIPTPIKDDLIFGKNILEEWNKFADNYKPVLLSEIKFDVKDDPEESTDFQSQLQGSMAPSGITLSEISDEVSKAQAQHTSEAVMKLEKEKAADQGTNTTLLLNSVLGEIKQMNDLFKSFKDIFEKIDKEALQVIVKKPNEQ